METPANNVTQDRWVSATEASEIVGYSASSLAKFRLYGGGPPYAKRGRGRQSQIRYRVSELHHWMELHVRVSTSDTGAGA